jgi:hypothetical protein
VAVRPDGWTQVPSVLVLAAESDARLTLVRDAVYFWNRSLAEIGSAFRLGTVTQTTGELPVDELKALSATILGSMGPRVPPQSIGLLRRGAIGGRFRFVRRTLAEHGKSPGSNQKRPALPR